jgi:hypothetical protein
MSKLEDLLETGVFQCVPISLNHPVFCVRETAKPKVAVVREFHKLFFESEGKI